MNKTLTLNKKYILLLLTVGILIGFLPFFSFWGIFVLSAGLSSCMLVGAFIYNKIYNYLAVPFFLLIAGTFAFGRAFSILGISIGSIPVFVTEISIMCTFILIMLYGKMPNFKLCLPSDILNVLFAYLLFGTIYLFFGLIKNGPLAFRDIVYCHYLLFLIMVLMIFRTQQQLEILLRVMIPSTICALLTGINILTNYIPKESFVGAFLSHTRSFNTSLSYGLLIIFGISYFSYIKRGKIWVSILIILLMITNILFLISTTWVAMTITIGFLCVISLQEIKLFIRYNIIIILLIFIAILILYIIHPNIFSGLGGEWHALFNWGTGAGANIVWRFDIWYQTLIQTAGSPFFGRGFGAYPTYFTWGRQSPPVTIIGPGSEIIPTHNHLVGMFYKFGIIGTLIFLIINFRIFFYGLSYIKKCKIEFDRRFLVACLTGIVYWHCFAFFFDVMESPPTSIFLWILLGLTLCVINIDKNA